MRWIRRIVFGLAVVILAAVAGLAALVAVEGLQGPARLDALTNTLITSRRGPTIVRAYVARPTTPGPHPAVILIHEFWGLNAEIIGKAKALADEGYVVVAPDTFRGSTTAMVPRAIYQVVTNRAEQVDGDLDDVFAWLTAQPDVRPDRIAIMGFCYGGATSIRYAVNNPRIAATAVFYGSPITDKEKLRALGGPVLGIFGGADASIPLDSVRRFEQALAEAGVRHEISIYDGQPHAFVQSVEGIRQGGAQGRAWDQLRAFLAQSLKSGAPGATPTSARRATDELSAEYLLRLALSHFAGGHAH